MKNIRNKCDDPYLGLLSYRSSTLHNGYTPLSELLMSRQLRTTVPVYPRNLEPRLVDKKKVQMKERIYKDNQKLNYNTRHRA